MENLDSVTSAEQVNETYQKYENEFINVLNKHAPLKSRYPRRKPLPCMNGELRKAIYRKHMLYSQYTKIAIIRLGKNSGSKEISLIN